MRLAVLTCLYSKEWNGLIRRTDAEEDEITHRYASQFSDGRVRCYWRENYYLHIVFMSAQFHLCLPV